MEFIQILFFLILCYFTITWLAHTMEFIFDTYCYIRRRIQFRANPINYCPDGSKHSYKQKVEGIGMGVIMYISGHSKLRKCRKCNRRLLLEHNHPDYTGPAPWSFWNQSYREAQQVIINGMSYYWAESQKAIALEKIQSGQENPTIAMFSQHSYEREAAIEYLRGEKQ